MKKIYVYSLLLMIFVLAISCDFEDSVADVKLSSGEADFTTYVALGNSLTSGYQDGALYKSGQENSYPSMIAKGMNLSEQFNQPLMVDDLGGIPSLGLSNKRILAITEGGLSPVVAKGEGKTTLANIYTGTPFHNLGVPGAKLAHLLFPGYGNPIGLLAKPATANPYYVRFASSPDASIIADAMAIKPTFFSLWIGNNDVLGYATSGGDGSNPLTSEGMFAQYYDLLVKQLTSAGAKGVVANIPSVTSIPFFNTIPNNALVLDDEKAKSLTGFFKAISGIATQVLISKGLPAEKANALAGQYAITFHKGANRFLIEVPKTQANPLGFRQMAEEELLVLTIDRGAMKSKGYGSVQLTPGVMATLGKLQAGQMPTQAELLGVIQAVNPIKDKDALDAEELVLIANATQAFNTTIKNVADKYGLALYDANKVMKNLSENKLRIKGVDYSSEFVTGGVFSLDGVHPNQRGYAIIANGFIQAINTKYNSNLPEVDPNSYEGVKLP